MINSIYLKIKSKRLLRKNIINYNNTTKVFVKYFRFYNKWINSLRWETTSKYILENIFAF